MKKRTRKPMESVQLEMTPMIDVVFQLLIFFLVTLKQDDIWSHLDVSRPSPDPNSKPEEKPDLLEIIIYNEAKLGGEGYSLRGNQVRLADLKKHMTRVATFSKNVSVIIKCTGDSRHANLVKVLDICSEAGMKNLSVFSM